MTSEPDVLDRTLTAAFDAAHTDPRWSGGEWHDPVRRVRAASRTARLQVASLVAVAAVAVAGGGVTAVHTLRPGPDRLRLAPAAPASGTGTGLDWLLTPEQYKAYGAVHPSPSPDADVVASPAPIDADANRLQADVVSALGEADVLRIDAADGGLAGHAVLWLRVDGTPVAVERYRLDYPLLAGWVDQPGPTATPAGGTRDAAPREDFTTPQTWPDGTAYTVATGDAVGYAFGPDEQWTGPIVWTVTPDGWLTWWTAPVTPDRLLGWAHVAADHFAAG
jgi:hypothetical protein